MKHVEVFIWRVRGSGGKDAFVHMTLDDGRAMGPQLVPGSAAYAQLPETNDELIESWMTGTPFRISMPLEEAKAA